MALVASFSITAQDIDERKLYGLDEPRGIRVRTSAAVVATFYIRPSSLTRPTSELKTAREAAEAGRRTDLIPEGGVWPDMVVEFKPERPGGAQIVWKWHSWDHLIQDVGANGVHTRQEPVVRWLQEKGHRHKRVLTNRHIVSKLLIQHNSRTGSVNISGLIKKHLQVRSVI